MEGLTAGSYEQHHSCSVGERVVAALDDGQAVSGTVVKHAGATVYVASDEGGVLEFRRATDSETGERTILLGRDGKALTDHGLERGVTSEGTLRTERVSSHSYDHRVVEFRAESRELVLGGE